MTKINFTWAAICGVLTFSSCSEEVSNFENSSEEAAGLVSIYTRGEGDELNVDNGMVYIMNQDGACIHQITMDADTKQITASLTKGTYDVYAIGGTNLSNLSLPDQENALPSSIVKPKEGEVLGDLLAAHSSLTIEEGIAKDLNINLERKVFKIETIKIKDVPEDVSAIKLSITPVRDRILLDGTYTEDMIQTNINLSKNSDGIWEAQASYYSFPSIGKPTLTISATSSAGEKHYSYIADEEIKENTKVSIEATYSEELESVFTATLFSKAWGESKAISFDFDEDNVGNKKEQEDTAVPTVGQTYNGYYVVSVDSENKKAVLLRKKQDNGISTEEELATKFGKLNKPTGAIGDWRLPTPEECAVFVLDATLPYREYDYGYYCKDGDVIKSYNFSIEEGKLKHTDMTEGLNANTWFRPVIEIAY